MLVLRLPASTGRRSHSGNVSSTSPMLRQGAPHSSVPAFTMDTPRSTWSGLSLRFNVVRPSAAALQPCTQYVTPNQAVRSIGYVLACPTVITIFNCSDYSIRKVCTQKVHVIFPSSLGFFVAESPNVSDKTNRKPVYHGVFCQLTV